jgi:hypothetical protein
MTDQLDDTQLGQAAANLERLHDYFRSRTTWQVGDGGSHAAATLSATLERTCRDALQPLLAATGIKLPTAPPTPPQPDAPEGRLDRGRLDRFSAFVSQLGSWLMAQHGKAVSEAGRIHLLSIARHLVGTTTAVGEILRTLEPDDSPGPSEADEPEVEHIDTRLVLEDTEEAPLLQLFRGNIELTHEAKRAIHAFLAQARVSSRGADLIRFERKVQQWIEATPHGHVLVIKVSCLSGHPQTYPRYERKSASLSEPAHQTDSDAYPALS